MPASCGCPVGIIPAFADVRPDEGGRIGPRSSFAIEASATAHTNGYNCCIWMCFSGWRRPRFSTRRQWRRGGFSLRLPDRVRLRDVCPRAGRGFAGLLYAARRQAPRNFHGGLPEPRTAARGLPTPPCKHLRMRRGELESSLGCKSLADRGGPRGQLACRGGAISQMMKRLLKLVIWFDTIRVNAHVVLALWSMRAP